MWVWHLKEALLHDELAASINSLEQENARHRQEQALELVWRG